MSKICFIIPYFNHAQTIKKVATELVKYEIPIIIIDDGSDLEAKSALNDINATILTHQINSGKGAAIKTAAKYAFENGFTHMFQIDADAQHDLNRVEEFLKMHKSSPKAMICGYGEYGEDAPKIRLYVRKITAFWVYINTLGASFKDTMTGFRIYPVDLAVLKATRSDRMEFDIEVLIRFYRHKTPIIFAPVAVRYGAVSHFRAFRDNLLISKMHAKMFLSLPKLILQRFWS